MIGKTIHELSQGEKAEFSKTISETDIHLYAGVTGDFNPAHINQAYAEKTFFKSRIAHGLLSAGLISTVIGTVLPGPGTIYLKQELNFIAPVYIGDTVTAYVKIIEIIVTENRVLLETICKNQNNELLIEGQALVSPCKKLDRKPG